MVRWAKNWNSLQIRWKWYDWARKIWRFINACENLMNPCEYLWISLRTFRFLYFAEFLANLYRMLQILMNAVANLKNACKQLTNETNTQRVLANFVTLSLIRQHPSSQVVLFCICLKNTCMKNTCTLACPRGTKRDSCGRGMDNGKSDHPPSCHKKIPSFKSLL